jgi:hypothetical protein
MPEGLSAAEVGTEIHEHAEQTAEHLGGVVGRHEIRQLPTPHL